MSKLFYRSGKAVWRSAGECIALWKSQNYGIQEERKTGMYAENGDVCWASRIRRHIP